MLTTPGNRQSRADVGDEVMLVRIRSAVAVVVSSAAHIAVILIAARGAAAGHPTPDDPVASADPWIGETFEVGLTPSLSGGASEQGSQTTPQQPAAGSEPEAPKLPAPPAATEPAHVVPVVPAAPRVEHKPRVKPASSAASSSSSPSSSADSTPGQPRGSGSASSPGAYGMQGDGRGGPRDLSRAFTRAIPVAVSADPVWGTLPLGPAGSCDLKIVLGDDGRIVSATPEGHVAEHFRVVASRTVAMLGAGTFAIKAEPGAGLEVLRIGATISNVEGAPAEDRSSAGAYGLGFEPPSRDRPGKAHFTLRSGRHIEITVRVLRIE